MLALQARANLRRAALAACVHMAMASCGTAYAAEWAAEPSIRFQALYDDNIHLSTDRPNSALGLFVTPELALHQRTEVSELSLNGRFDSRRYPGDAELDSDNQDLSLAGSYQTERSTWQWKSQVRRATTLITELADTGLLSAGKQRDDLTLTPSWTYVLSPETSVQLAYSATDTSYEDGAGLVDYRFQVLSGGVFHRLSERNQLNFEVRGSRFNASDIGTETDAYEILAGISRVFSETSRGSLQIGAVRSSSATEQRFGPLLLTRDDSATGSLLNMQAEREFEVTRLSFSAKRQLMPSGGGRLNLSDQVSVTLRRRLAPTVEGLIEATGLRNRATEGDSSTDRDFYSARSGLYWSLNNWWRLGTTYEYVRQKYDNAEDSAASNRVLVSLAYTWPKKAIAR